MRGILFVIFTLWVLTSVAQQHVSIHQAESEYYKTHLNTDTVAAVMPKSVNNAGCTLNRRVFGWHPSWVGSTVANNYQWNLLSDLCYFSYEFNASTGAITATNGFLTSPVVDSAQAHGTRVHLCVTMFDPTDHTTFFASTTAQTNLITNLVNAVQTRNADGIDLDFEGVSSTHKAALTTFVQRISDSLHTRIPGAELSIAMPAVDWSPSEWDYPAIIPYVDLFIFMGYDYYYGGSGTAGPTDPLYNFQTSYNYTLSKTITYYLNAGVPKSKLLMGLPYYGFEWQTTALTVPASTISGTDYSRTYKSIRLNTSGNYSSANRGWDINSLSSYWAYSSAGLNYQAWVTDAQAMDYRLDLVNLRDIAGIGIWALSYDDGYTDFWDLIAAKLSDCAVVQCTDTIWDMGGPTRPHYANENYVYTIQPTGATGVSLDFTEFNLESGYDSLWIYDGTSTTSSLIGGYSGTTSPGLVTASGNALTLEFHSDGATQNAGYTAIWTCSTDNVPPTTAVNAPSGWQTDDFNVGFTDNDNYALDKSFWQVLQYNGSDWKGNNRIGFINENYNTSVPSDWTSYLGNWVWDSGHLLQTDSTLGNTNLAIPLPQDSSHAWLYHWQMKFGSADVTNNRRIGAHYFCSDIAQSNRENNYMAYFRLDNQKVQLYEYVNNSYFLMTDVVYPFVVDTWYDVKIMYDPETGYNAAWVNDELVSSWTDATPLKTGSGFSLRVGNSKAWYDDVKVYQSRSATEIVTVGPDTLDMVQWQNPDPTTPSCRIKSIVLDKANLFSTPAGEDVNIDYTKPVAPAWVGDVYAPAQSDYDTLYYSGILQNNTACAASEDPNSGVVNYYLGMGNFCGDTSFYSFVSSTDTTANIGAFGSDGLYYTFVYSVNGAGLHSDTICSDGIYVELLTGLKENADGIRLFPNPADDVLNIDFSQTGDYEVSIYSTDGRLVLIHESSNSKILQLDVSTLEPGVYMIEFAAEKTVRSVFIKK
ncbi:hypothetical protein SDC9_39304 [bioreactor metagenome]|uniref:GH18 domain-containing protein n=1 Tax=bioreactor metagenome TaxID=1076179 RepID=A0A644VP69_9ZZZZ